MNIELSVLRKRALRLARVGRPARAAALLREALRVDPSDIDTHVRLGLILRDLGRDEEANRVFQAALDLQRRAGRPGGGGDRGEWGVGPAKI